MPTLPFGRRITSLTVILLALSAGHSLLQPDTVRSGMKPDIERLVLLPDDRLVSGTVQDVRSGFIQVNIGQLQPVVLSVGATSEKGMPSLQPGDKLTIIVSNENEFIDFHLADQPGWDRMLIGRLIQPVVAGQRWAVIRTAQGLNEPYEVAEGARQKVLNIPVGVPAMYLLNKANLIIDATFGEERALMETLVTWSTARQQMIHR
jgi:hypothetical protein